MNTVPSAPLARGFRAGSAEPNDSIHIVMSANMIAERTIKTAALSEEIEICGVSATCVIVHSASPPSNKVEQSF
jgi:hypothetical protein